MSLENGSSSIAVEHGATPAAARTHEASASPRSTVAGRPAAAPPYGAETSETAPTFTPLIDIHEGPDGLVLVADIPGASESDVQIEVEDNVLSLRAHVAPSAPEGSRLLHQEFHTGDFQRSFILSDEVDREAIS
ncbi:MAG: Hsp20/alpha crystallin family protein, partial [Planctomycetota bacterium]|nr:Hsp20/alpha crystallin family protein [Planctomycetota bacterium]